MWVGFIFERKKRFDSFYQGRWPMIKKVSWEGRVTIFTGYRKKGLLRGREKRGGGRVCHALVQGDIFFLIRKMATLQRCVVVLDRKKGLLMRCMSAKWGGCDSPPRFWLIWLKYEENYFNSPNNPEKGLNVLNFEMGARVWECVWRGWEVTKYIFLKKVFHFNITEEAPNVFILILGRW